jgi:hypothetical protein
MARVCDLLLKVLDLRLEFGNHRIGALQEHVHLAGLLLVEAVELVQRAEGRAHDGVVGVKGNLKAVSRKDGNGPSSLHFL